MPPEPINKSQPARDPALTWGVPPELGPASCVGPARAAFEAASAGHTDALAAQLLEAEGVANVRVWAPVIGRLAREAAGFVSPAAGGQDLHASIKIKRLATDTELPHASMAIDGVACHKTASHKRMRTLIQGPRVVTLSGALEPPAADTDKLSSIDALGSAGQRLTHCVDSIKELQPDVVCVEGGAARGAQEALLEAGVSLVTGVKPALLARIARCVGSAVRPVGGQLNEECVGSCQVFEVFQPPETPGGEASEEPASLMLFKGCCRGKGATIVLQGLSREELAKVKRAARWAAYAALWNAREAAFLADDFALAAANLLPQLTEEAAGAEAGRLAAESAAAAATARADGTRLITSASPHVSVFHGAEELTLEETHLDFASAQKLVLASSCRNPAKAGAALCEPPHLLDMPFYRSEDLPLPEFLQAAAPAASKCGQCGEKASLHLRSFFHGDALVTLSSVVLPPEGELPEGVWYWLRRLKDPRTDAEVHRVRLDPDSERISFAHLLQLLLDGRHRRLGGASLHHDFVRYFGAGRTVVCLHLMRVNPYAVCTPAPALHVAREATAGWLAEEAKVLVETADELFDSLQAAVSELPGADAAAAAESCADIRKDFIKLVRDIPTGPDAQVMSSLQDLDRLRSHLADLAAKCAPVTEPPAAALPQPKGSKSAPELEQNLTPSSAHSRASSGASSAYGVPAPPAPDAARAPTLVDSGTASAASSPSFRDHPEAIPTGLVARFVAKFQQHEQTEAAASERERVGSLSRKFGPSTTIDLRRGSELRRSSTIDESLENKLERLSISIAQLHATPETPGATSEDREKQRQTQAGSLPLLQALFSARAMALDEPEATTTSPPVFVYDKEPTSIVAFFLSSKQYQAYVDDAKASCLTAYDSAATEDAQAPTNATEDEQVLRAPLQLDCQMIAEDESSLPTTRARFQMTAYYAPHFATLRKLCVAGREESYLASMRRCVPWAAQGGKSNVFFAKTRDGRYIIKQLTKVEKQSVLEYAPDYFKHLEASLIGEGTSCLAKILGIYQVQVDYASGRPSPISKDGVVDFIVMENLFHDCHVHTVYDLKGSERDRYVTASDLQGVKGGGPITLLDDNLRELNRASPTLVTPAAFIKLQQCLCEDTNFLASLGVMDYSLLVGFDKVRQELVVGLVDYVRQYTWDKQVESWVKKSGLLGGAGKEPTIISPLQYARRFREAMLSYFTVVPCLGKPPEDICEPD